MLMLRHFVGREIKLPELSKQGEEIVFELYVNALNIFLVVICDKSLTVQPRLSVPRLSVPWIIQTPEPKKVHVEERKFSFNQVFNCEQSDLNFTLLRESTLASSLWL